MSAVKYCDTKSENTILNHGKARNNNHKRTPTMKLSQIVKNARTTLHKSYNNNGTAGAPSWSEIAKLALSTLYPDLTTTEQLRKIIELFNKAGRNHVLLWHDDDTYELYGVYGMRPAHIMFYNDKDLEHALSTLDTAQRRTHAVAPTSTPFSTLNTILSFEDEAVMFEELLTLFALCAETEDDKLRDLDV